jgi:hypothetical protein
MASPPPRAWIRSVGTAWGAEAACSGAWSRGPAPALIRSLPYTLACTAKPASGTAGGFVGRQPVTICYGYPVSSICACLHVFLNPPHYTENRQSLFYMIPPSACSPLRTLAHSRNWYVRKGNKHKYRWPHHGSCWSRSFWANPLRWRCNSVLLL